MNISLLRVSLGQVAYCRDLSESPSTQNTLYGLENRCSCYSSCFHAVVLTSTTTMPLFPWLSCLLSLPHLLPSFSLLGFLYHFTLSLYPYPLPLLPLFLHINKISTHYFLTIFLFILWKFHSKYPNLTNSPVLPYLSSTFIASPYRRKQKKKEKHFSPSSFPPLHCMLVLFVCL